MTANVKLIQAGNKVIQNKYATKQLRFHDSATMLMHVMSLVIYLEFQDYKC